MFLIFYKPRPSQSRLVSSRLSQDLRTELEGVGAKRVTIPNFEPVYKLQPLVRLRPAIIDPRHRFKERDGERARDDVVDSNRAETQRHDVGEVETKVRRDASPQRHPVRLARKVKVKPLRKRGQHGDQTRFTLSSDDDGAAASVSPRR